MKSAVGPSAPWEKRVKYYNKQISQNADRLSIASDDSVWDDLSDVEDMEDNKGIIAYFDKPNTFEDTKCTCLLNSFNTPFKFTRCYEEYFIKR